MADKKIIGKLENIITFSVNKASLNQALASIKRVKDAMKSAVSPITAARSSTKLDPALKRQRELNRAHTQAIIEDRKRTATITNKIANDEFKAQKKLDNQRNAQQAKAVKFDRRAQATQEWFGTTFGRGGQRKATGLYNDLRAGKINAEQYSMRLRTLRGDLYRSQRAQRGFNQSIHDMRGAFVQATASYTAFAGVMGIANIGKQYESRYAGMLVGTGSAEQARSQISYLDKEVYRLGLDIGIASQGLVQMSVAANGVMSNGQIQGLFTGLSELSTAVKLDPFRYEKAIMAISQMLNKGQLMAEEVKSQ